MICKQMHVLSVLTRELASDHCQTAKQHINQNVNSTTPNLLMAQFEIAVRFLELFKPKY